MTGVFYVANDHVLELRNLRDNVSGVFINNATVVVTIKDSAGANVTGETWPKSMPYVAASNGIYRATLDATLGIASGSSYTARITVTTPLGADAYWEFPVRGDTRKQ